MLKNFVLETANAPGTATGVTLAGPPAGRVSFVSQFGGGATCYYFATDDVQSEAGVATLTAGPPDTLTRPAAVLWNSAGTTARLNFTGTVRFYNEIPANALVWRDAIGDTTFGGKVRGVSAAAIGSDAARLDQVGWTLIQQQILSSGTAALIFALPAGFAQFRVEWQEATPNAPAPLAAIISTDGGATYHQGATDYNWFCSRLSAGANANDSATQGLIRLSPATVNAGEFQLGNWTFSVLANQVGTFDATGLAAGTFDRCMGAARGTFGGTPTNVQLSFVGSTFANARARLFGSLS